MSGLDVDLGTVACIAAVISAYRDGDTIIEKIKMKRFQMRVTLPSRMLEDSIDQASADIEREKKRGIQRFGKAFDSGDMIAVIALQQITIELRSCLLERLRNAAFDDSVTELRYLVDVAHAQRDKTINTLIHLQQRLLASESIVHDLSPISTIVSTIPAVSSHRLRAFLPHPVPLSPPPKDKLRPVQTWAQSRQAADGDDCGGKDAAYGAENILRILKPQSSLLSMIRNRMISYGGSSRAQTPTVPMKGVQESRRPASPVHPLSPQADTVAPDARSFISTSSVYSTQSVATKWNFQPWNDLAKIGGAKAGPSISSPDQISTDRTIGSSSVISQPFVPSNLIRGSSVAILKPTPENDYLGFCKNAVRLQNGDRGAFEKRADYACSRSGYSAATVYVSSCKSSKCNYKSHLKADTIWERVWTDPELGMKWRWTFLAKSHVRQKQHAGQQFSYQCVFCTFGTGRGPIYHGSRMYLQHVASHRGEISEVLKYKATCINDRICEEDDEFDINLYPLKKREERDHEPSPITPEKFTGLHLSLPESEFADSM